MKFAIRMCLLCLLLGATSAWATVVGSTNPNLFPDTVDWCAQATFACDGGNYHTAQPFISAFGHTGLVGLPFNSQDFQALQEGSSHFGGSFPDGMGLIYTGVQSLGNAPNYIGVTFDQPQWGAGAYIQPYWYGPFTAEVILYDTHFNVLGSYSINGNSTDQTSDLLFIGASNSTQDVGGVLFVAGTTGHAGDFEIGTLGLATPEPASILLMAPSMLGLYGIVRRRRSRQSQEVL